MPIYNLLGVPDTQETQRNIYRHDGYSVGSGTVSLDVTGGEAIAGDTDRTYHLNGIIEGTADGASDLSIYLKLNTSNGNYHQQQLIGAGNTNAVVARFNGNNNWYLGYIPHNKAGAVEFDITIHCHLNRVTANMLLSRHNYTDHTVDVVLSSGQLELNSQITAISLEMTNVTASTQCTYDLNTPGSDIGRLTV